MHLAPAPTLHSLLLLLDGDRILLARKRRGFGRGKIVGIGGRAEPGETIRQTAVREMIEETSVTPLRPRAVADLDFTLPDSARYPRLRVVVFTAEAWEGEPQPSDEVIPAWYPVGAIPYGEMWDDARLWLPRVLAGERFSARFVLDEGERVTEHDFGAWGDAAE
jgi:8-oxo-dGTP diphosphatase